MRTLIVCPTAHHAKELQEVYFPVMADGPNDTYCTAAGSSLLGFHFHRVVFMPGWDCKMPWIGEQSGKEWVRLTVMNRLFDKKTAQIIYL